jgi:hypothetical protein
MNIYPEGKTVLARRFITLQFIVGVKMSATDLWNWSFHLHKFVWFLFAYEALCCDACDVPGGCAQ